MKMVQTFILLNNILNMFSSELLFVVPAAIVWILLWLIFRKPLSKYGITIYPLAIIIKSERLKKYLMLFAKKYQKFARKLSILGLIVSVPIIFYSLYSVILILIKSLSTHSRTSTKIDLLAFTKMPLVELIMFTIILALSVVLHEFSHGISCFAEGKNVKSIGAFFIFPFFLGGYVVPDFDFDELVKKREKRLLRIYAQAVASGLFITFLLTLIFFLLLAHFPLVVSPLFRQGSGALVTHVEKTGPAWGKLCVGDVILKINETIIKTPDDVVNFVRNAKPGSIVVIYLLDRIVTLRLGTNPVNNSWGYLGVELFQYFIPTVAFLKPIHAFYIWLVFFYGYFINYVLLIFNALPVIIFDGGKVIWSVLNIYFGKKGEKIFTILQGFTVALIITLFAASFIH